MVTNEGSIAEGLMDVASTDIEDVTGERPKTARELTIQYAYIWENNVQHWRDIK